MISLVDITFHANSEFPDTDALVKAQSVSLIYVGILQQKMDIDVIKHISNPQTIIHETPGYRFFRTRNGFFNIPFETLMYLKKKNPDFVMVQGLIFPIQVLALRFFLGKKVKIILNHHADRPLKSVKKYFQRLADKSIDQYLFSSFGNAAEWIDCGQIKGYEKITQLPPTLTWFHQLSKAQCRWQLKWDNGMHYIWVGRLNVNKDPFTLIEAFENFLQVQPEAKLHLIYQSTELLDALTQKVSNSELLKNAVFFEAYIPNDELITWYNASNYFISTSHMEGGSVSILEAMACGCIPIVTSIPASLKTIKNGEYGYCFSPGKVDELFDIFVNTSNTNQHEFANKMEQYFQEEFSVAAVCDKLYRLCIQLNSK